MKHNVNWGERSNCLAFGAFDLAVTHLLIPAIVWMIALAGFVPTATCGETTQVFAWGRNGSGQTNVPVTLSNAVAVEAAGYASLALTVEGKVVAWGNNSQGQADPPTDLTNVVGIAGGWVHNLAILSDGTVRGWGSDFYGETTIPSGLSNVVAIEAGYYFSVALRADGTVIAWGSNENGATNVPTGLNDVMAIAAGSYHVVALQSNGSLATWGGYWDGVGYAPVTVPPGLSNVVDIAAGYNFSVAVRADGSLIGWGPAWVENWYNWTNLPPEATNIVAVAVSEAHILALRWDGRVVAWGYNANGESTVPSALSNVVAISAGGSDGLYHSVALAGGGPVVPPPTLSLNWSNGLIQVTLSGEPRSHYVLEESTQVGPGASWAFKRNIFLMGQSQTLSDLGSDSAGTRFYRAHFVP